MQYRRAIRRAETQNTWPAILPVLIGTIVLATLAACSSAAPRDGATVKTEALTTGKNETQPAIIAATFIEDIGASTHLTRAATDAATPPLSPAPAPTSALEIAQPPAIALGVLVVTVSELESSAGSISYEVFDNALNFDNRLDNKIADDDPNRALRWGSCAIDAAHKNCRFTLSGLPYGDYAVLLGHDRDGDGDQRDFRCLREPSGASGYGQVTTRPDFDRAKVALAATSLDIEIAMDGGLMHGLRGGMGRRALALTAAC